VVKGGPVSRVALPVVLAEPTVTFDVCLEVRIEYAHAVGQLGVQVDEDELGIEASREVHRWPVGGQVLAGGLGEVHRSVHGPGSLQLLEVGACRREEGRNARRGRTGHLGHEAQDGSVCGRSIFVG
jgi:hypothetical protein